MRVAEKQVIEQRKLVQRFHRFLFCLGFVFGAIFTGVGIVLYIAMAALTK